MAFYPPKPVGGNPTPGAPWTPMEQYQKLYENTTWNRDEYFNESLAFELLPPFLKGNNTHGRDRYFERWATPKQYQVGMTNYHALVSHVDNACQRIFDEVVKQELENKMLFIFTGVVVVNNVVVVDCSLSSFTYISNVLSNNASAVIL